MRITTKLLSNEFLSQLNQVRYTQRKRSAIGETGKVKSMRSGGHADFHEFRPYRRGDEPRFIDWNIYQRLNQFVVKTYSQQENTTHYILIDGTESMTFDSMSKANKTCQIAAMIVFLALSNDDSVKIIYSGLSNHQTKIFTSKSQIPEAITHLQNIEFSGNYAFDKHLSVLKEIKSPGVAYILSDFYEYEKGLKAISGINKQKLHINLLQILSYKEKLFPQRGLILLQDSETVQQVKMMVNEKTAQIMQKEYNLFLQNLKERANAMHASCLQLEAENSFQETIQILRKYNFLA